MGFPRSPIKWLLYPLVMLYDLVARLRNLWFDKGWRSVERLDKPVISIGNLTMGGTGKSPVCADVVSMLLAQGKRVAVLSRGYGRREPEKARVVDPNGDWRDYGDEPFMIAARHPEAMVCVGPNRYAAAKVLDQPVDVYVIDDGFQHRQLYRDLDIVLIDVTQPKPHAFAPDLARERFGALKRADLVLLTRWDGQAELESWRKAVHRANPELPIFSLGFRPAELRFLDGREPWPVSRLKGLRAGAWSGIAGPEKFFDSLTDLGVDLIATKPLADHEPIEEQSLRDFGAQCAQAGATLLITTEKDMVKLVPDHEYGIILAFLFIKTYWTEKGEIECLLRDVFPRGKGK